MKNYYKLIEQYPNSDKIGTIYFTDVTLSRNNVFKECGDNLHAEFGKNLSIEDLESKFFEKSLQLTEDGFPVFDFDTVYYVDENNKMNTFTFDNKKRFDTTYRLLCFKFKENCIEYRNENFVKYFPQIWSELPQKNGYYVSTESKIKVGTNYNDSDKNVCVTSKQALSQLAFAQLTKLSEEINDNWEANWDILNISVKYTICRENNSLIACDEYYRYAPICFKTAEFRDFSMKYHNDLWRQYYQLD